MKVEGPFALHEEHTWRALVAARRVPIVATRLHQVRGWGETELRRPLWSLDVRTGHNHDIHGMRVRVKRNSESRRQLEEGAEPAFGGITP
jgi:hypothetical protein